MAKEVKEEDGRSNRYLIYIGTAAIWTATLSLKGTRTRLTSKMSPLLGSHDFQPPRRKEAHFRASRRGAQPKKWPDEEPRTDDHRSKLQ